MILHVFSADLTDKNKYMLSEKLNIKTSISWLMTFKSLYSELQTNCQELIPITRCIMETMEKNEI
jgi:hypothetical protein